MKRGQGQWTKLLRRSVALFLATVTVWVLSLTADMGAAADTIRTLAESPAFVSAALRAELGSLPEEDGLESLTGWERLALSQSPTLLAGIGGRGGEEAAQPAATEEPEEDPDDPCQVPAVTSAPEDIVGRTLLPVSESGYDAALGVYIENRPQLDLDVAALAEAPLELEIPEEGPQVLIMHTHGSEAYTPDGEDVYEPTGECRTADKTKSVVRVGEEIAKVLTEMGLSVVHDTALYDYPEYNGAYDRSLAAVESYLEQYPTIRVVLDVHRDALVGEDGTIYKPITTVNGEDSAQVMLVMGSNALYDHPKWEENLSLAVKIQAEMNTLWPTLARPIGLRENRYNQQLTTGSLLVEVGSHGNTLQEALAAARMFARAAGAVLLDYKG
ncbi:MAG TPA: stage II sporulation protein P [Candidatus Intestinimonas stercoravium]|uniref:stage II sporulation protein P n=1 Tax=uncultured Intestinimonas sp. TaxID=1689265 RepID=UPI001F9595EB|nr:stage II sporulation protein P [uncultured Intestinimonas sp.]HJA64557.1 stage II sporulation protein P [Candidatus Intestinimonas stercoravium]